MPCLRTRYNAAAVYLGDEKLKGRALTEGMVAVQLSNGEYKYVPFSGFSSSLSEGQRVKLVNVEAFTIEPFAQPWLDFGRGAFLLGVFQPGRGAYCYLEHDTPIAWCPMKDEI